jgi:cell shape-determining protein MreC
MERKDQEMMESITASMASAIVQANRERVVSQKIDNPLIWISFLGVMFLAMGALILFIYSENQGAQNNGIQSNQTAIEELKKSIESVADSVKDIQIAAHQQSEASKELLSEVKELRATDHAILSSRFEDKDFPIHMQPFEGRLANAEKELAARAQTVSDVESLKKENYDIKARLKILEDRTRKD